MKKVIYQTGWETVQRSKQLTAAEICAITMFESTGMHVVLSKDVPDEPKVERCAIHGAPGLGALTYIKENPINHSIDGHEWSSISDAVNDPLFAGYEFEDGDVDVYPWRKKGNSFFGIIIEHAKYVLFRKGA